MEEISNEKDYYSETDIPSSVESSQFSKSLNAVQTSVFRLGIQCKMSEEPLYQNKKRSVSNLGVHRDETSRL